MQEFLGERVFPRVDDSCYDDVRMAGQDVSWLATRREHFKVDVRLGLEGIEDDGGKQPRKVNERHADGHAFSVTTLQPG